MYSLERISCLKTKTVTAERCRNLLARYMYLQSTGRYEEYLALWSDRGDVSMEMPWGVYLGRDGVRRCYETAHGSLYSSAPYWQYHRDIRSLYRLDTEIIEIAEDGNSAWGQWLSPGCETIPGIGACWNFCTLTAVFVREAGDWKLLRMRVYPYFKSGYHSFFADELVDPSAGFEDDSADLPPHGVSYTLDGKNGIPTEPDAPRPYETLGDLAGICG